MDNSPVLDEPDVEPTHKDFGIQCLIRMAKMRNKCFQVKTDRLPVALKRKFTG
jgi:hypothetical protein